MDGGAQQERVPHPIIMPGDQQTAFSNSQLPHPKVPKISSHIPEIPPYSQPIRRSPPPSEPQALIPSIPHPPRRTPNPTPAHKNQNDHRPQTSKRPQGSNRPQASILPLGSKAHLPTAQFPLTQQYANPLLTQTPLSPSQLHSQRQQLITAYMMQSGGGAALAQPFLFPGGGLPVPPIQAPHAPPQASPAPAYTQVEAIVAEMRENMLKVLKTANYKRCKSAKNIRQALRQVRTLCKDIRNETTEMGKQKVNPRKKAATPDGDEAPTKKQKTKNPEEGLKQEGEGDPTLEEGARAISQNRERLGDAQSGEAGAHAAEGTRSGGEGGVSGVERSPPKGDGVDETKPEQGDEMGRGNAGERKAEFAGEN